MTQSERRTYLISALLKEQPQYPETEIPKGEAEQKILLRSLFNIRMPIPVSGEFSKVQDEYLQEEIKLKGVTDIADLQPVQDGIYLWKGDITTLKCDAVVNAANSQMLGCFCPNHGCIDNAIHTYAGVGLRLECAKIMNAQRTAEPTGKAKITRAYNLPCRYVLHTVGPIVSGVLTKKHCEQLASCYRSCLELAEQYNLKSVAFCCISTGEFRFPNDRAAETAIQAVKEYKTRTQSEIKVIFNVFKEIDYNIYRKLLGADK
ncbi:MAG: protein-ADP-ribose hydrolase [Clostridiales bacterium]|nr:protein-ADP-ribose hydrolase [Clostridiales bacterium]